LKLHYAAALLAVSIVATFTLSGLARIPEQTASLQWMEEITNFFGQGLLALAMLIVWRLLSQKTQGIPVNE
jgi:thiol:disulfide interchange protein